VLERAGAVIAFSDIARPLLAQLRVTQVVSEQELAHGQRAPPRQLYYV
jgi:hypothetical protein